MGLEPWFLVTANDLVVALEKYGTTYEYFYRDQSYDKLEHGYMGHFESNPYARECYEHMLRFVEVSLGKG